MNVDIFDLGIDEIDPFLVVYILIYKTNIVAFFLDYYKCNGSKHFFILFHHL